MDIVALGETLIDFAIVSSDEAGYPVLSAKPGGAPANFLAAASAFGCETAILSKVGTDVFGRLLEQTLRSQRICTEGLKADPDFFTTLAFVTIDPATGERQFSFARKPGADTQLRWEEISKPLLDSCKVLHFGTLSLTDSPAREATQKAIAYAKQQGRLISFDPNLRKPLWNSLEDARTQMLWGLKQADIVKISDDEIEFLFGGSVESGIQTILQDYGATVVFGTEGRKGCRYATRTVRGQCPGFRVNSIDATGAGDIFGGTALALLMQTPGAIDALSPETLAEIARTASAAAALSTTFSGGISSIRPRADVLHFLETVS